MPQGKVSLWGGHNSLCKTCQAHAQVLQPSRRPWRPEWNAYGGLSALPPAPRLSTPPDGYSQNSNQDTVTRMSARCRDSHKGLLRAKWVSRLAAPVKESWRHGDRTPSPTF